MHYELCIVNVHCVLILKTMLSKKFRLTKRGSFNYVYRKGRGAGASVLKMLFVPSSATKIGFSVSNKIGKAVVRNLIKRQLRAIVRENMHLIKQKGQIVFVAKEGIEKVGYDVIKKDTLYLINKMFF